MARTRDELLGLFDEQIGYLEWSIRGFNAGRLAEAKRLAVTLRVLFHQTTQSTALINQLGLEKVLTWVDTAGIPDPDNLVTTLGLTGFRFVAGDSSDPEYQANLGDRPPSPIITRDGRRIPRGSRIPFDEWWTNTVIKDAAGNEFSRFKLVRALANREGGAHVDPVAQADYEALAKKNSLGWSVRVGDGDLRPLVQNPAYPSVRQFSYEVLESIRQQRDRIK